MRFLPQQNPPGTAFIFIAIISISLVAAGGQPLLLQASDGLVSLTTPSPLAACPSPGFGVQSVYPVDTSPTAVATGDFNGDGKVDLVVANKGSKSFSILLGNGDGTFQAAVTTPIPGLRYSGPLSVVAGDFDGDGKLDLAFANDTADKISILVGNGDATFRDAIITFAPSARFVAAGAFTGDGILDLAFAGMTDSGIFAVVSNGDGTFRYISGYGWYGSTLAVGDFTRDGKLDLAVPGQSGSKARILFGLGNGTFSLPPLPEFFVGGADRSYAAGDFDGNGRLDLAVADFSLGKVWIVLQQGSLTFQSPVSYPAGSKPWVVLGL